MGQTTISEPCRWVKPIMLFTGGQDTKQTRNGHTPNNVDQITPNNSESDSFKVVCVPLFTLDNIFYRMERSQSVVALSTQITGLRLVFKISCSGEFGVLVATDLLVSAEYVFCCRRKRSPIPDASPRYSYGAHLGGAVHHAR